MLKATYIVYAYIVGMFGIIRLNNYSWQLRLRLSKWWLLLPITIGVLVAGISIFYLFHSRDYLISCYQGISPCFYKSTTWADTFFTPIVKNEGNIYALTAIVLAALLFVIFLKKIRSNNIIDALQIEINRIDLILLLSLLFFYISIWIYGYISAYPAYDEVFSAINCARIHPFQTATYYMIPNNHVLFNLLNSLPTHLLNSPVASGRIISGIAGLLLCPILYFWLRWKAQSPYISAFLCAIVLLQFPVWAFSFQARGYAIYLLCCWSSAIFIEYYFYRKNSLALVIHAVAVVIGFFTVPSFLFWEIGLLLYICLRFIYDKRIDWTIIRTHVVAGIVVFILFTPLLLFSGTAALTDNIYVKSIPEQGPRFWYIAWDWLLSAIQYCFSGDVDARSWIYRCFFFLPFVLLPALWRTRAFSVVLLACLMWVAFFLAEAKLHRFPFMRNMVAHDSILLVALLLALYSLAKKFLPPSTKRIQIIGIGLFGIMLAAHFIRFNHDHVNDSIYFYKADVRYKSLHNAVMTLPQNARVGLSDEGFYWEYLCLRRGIPASMCMGPSATHYIKINSEPLPPYLIGHVQKWKTADEYEIYEVR